MIGLPQHVIYSGEEAIRRGDYRALDAITDRWMPDTTPRAVSMQAERFAHVNIDRAVSFWANVANKHDSNAQLKFWGLIVALGSAAVAITFGATIAAVMLVRWMGW